MAQIFSSNAGKVIALDVQDGMPAVLALEDFEKRDLILLTGLGIGYQANVQFMETLRDVVYIYSFGERMGEVEVQGLAFWQSCTQQASGFEQAYYYYRTKSVSQGQPIKLFIGARRAVLSGYLKGITGQTADPQSGTTRFTYQIASVPLGTR